jgi:hypothetical protein
MWKYVNAVFSLSLCDRWQQHAVKWRWYLCSFHMELILFSQLCSKTHCVILVLLSAALTGESRRFVRCSCKETVGFPKCFHLSLKFVEKVLTTFMGIITHG